jgi:general secretion pathway protein E
MAALLPLDYCLDHGLVLLASEKRTPDGPLTVGMIQAGDRSLVGDLSSKLGRAVVPVEMSGIDVRRALARLYDLPLGEAEGGLISLEESRPLEFPSDPSAAETVDTLLQIAITRRATDLHLEVYARRVDIRLRIDGVLHQVKSPVSPGNHGRVVSRFKVLSGMDVAERRRAQDGHFSVLYAGAAGVRRIDVRVCVLPGPHGQDVSLRILDPNRFILDLDGLQMPAGILQSYRRLSRSPHGLLLTAGPTGAGKTTTLYATLQELQDGSRKIVSVEDPVEFEFDAVNQKNVTGPMGYADYLRAFLRSNPDIIHVGEIRDPETAELAVRAGTTGHLVLGTIHTRDAVSAVARLRSLGVPDDLLSEVLIGVLGQRLVRRLCDRCKIQGPARSDLTSLYFERTPRNLFYSPGNCEQCSGTGYRGLIGVFELFEPDPAAAQAMGAGAPVEELRRIARSGRWVPLVEDGLRKAAEGWTSLDELARRIPPKYLPTDPSA